MKIFSLDVLQVHILEVCTLNIECSTWL